MDPLDDMKRSYENPEKLNLNNLPSMMWQLNNNVHVIMMY